MALFGESLRVDDEQNESIVADIFFIGFIVYEYSFDFVLIAPGADIVFGISGKIRHGYYFDLTVFWFLSDANMDIAAGSTVWMKRMKKCNSVRGPGSNNPS
jgi:hypothetical protein